MCILRLLKLDVDKFAGVIAKLECLLNPYSSLEVADLPLQGERYQFKDQGPLLGKLELF